MNDSGRHPVSVLPLPVLDLRVERFLAALNIAYHLTLLTTALDHPALLLPGLLIIDSPRKAIGAGDRDRELAHRIYARLVTLAEAYKDRIQLMVADNDIPAEHVTSRNMVELTSERSTVPGVTNTGVWTRAASRGSLTIVSEQPARWHDGPTAKSSGPLRARISDAKVAHVWTALLHNRPSASPTGTAYMNEPDKCKRSAARLAAREGLRRLG
ncbi:hypothetical protein OHA21_00980 [Actinoplanes sp. NBC_00393]|uniref:hypothetical protein n=1 Tax=Actinoplanes sp. NBC_00393 TaxID=2975953 RepID=UPI002E23EFD3